MAVSVPSTIRTIEDLERLYYGANEPLVEIAKATGAVTTAIGESVYNPVYGAYAWALLNMEANAFGVLPKIPWKRSGWRIIVGRAGDYASAGVAEGGAIPSAVYPDIVAVSTKPKVMAKSFEVSEIQEALASTEDDVYATLAQMKVFMAVQHKEDINKAILEKVSVDLTANYDPTSRLIFETLDRIISSSEEASFAQTDGTNTVQNYFDVYGLDRDADSRFDAVVNHNSGTLRPLTDEIIRDTLAQIRIKGGSEPTVILTGHDTYSTIQGIYSTYVRYNVLGQSTIQVGVNGIKTPKGAVEAGINVPTLYGIPIILSKDTPNDGTGSISRIYMIDTSDREGFGQPRLAIKILKPTQYFELTNPMLTGKFAYKGLYRTVGEVVAHSFLGHGKIRDIS